MGLISALFGTRSQRLIKKLGGFVAKVNSKKEWAQGLTEQDFKNKCQEYKEFFKNGGKEDDIIAEAFALIREAAKRTLGEFPYDVQIMGAAVLNRGEILEMKTGEGKTLTSSIAACFNAFKGDGVHVVTVNDYLAERDSKWMEPIYKYFGLTVGCILSDMGNSERKISYACDITYGTNNEFGFDYLRDNMKYRKEEKIQTNHNYCIIDEIDSILIDEARTPLIISAPAEDDSKECMNAAKIASFFKECEKNPETNKYYEVDPLEKFNAATWDDRGDYKLDEKSKSVNFTRDGMAKMEKILKENHIIDGELNSEENIKYVHYITQAVRALRLYKRDVDYIVNSEGVQIVDEFTGRILSGRRYSDGLHQALEAKEGVKILARSQTFATITLQNLFRMYKRISGMTGTAITEEQEFASIYNLAVTVLPTNVPVKRIDAEDYVFFNEKYKLDAVVDEIKKVHEKGQPILVGTVSIEKSELISSFLTRAGIKHNVLNAKNHLREAQIIAEAGSKGAVTIATNMAGRGTDIKLGGSIDHFIYKKIPTDSPLELYNKTKEEVYGEWEKASEEVRSLGGLYIIGTERHESRRIDNQLRGRSGRQGDPGFSRFYVSLDDDLMRLFAKDSTVAMLKRAGMDTPEPISARLVSRAIETAQKKVEERNYLIRKHLLEYDDVLNEQRTFIYQKRDEIIEEQNMIDRMKSNVEDIIEVTYEEEGLEKTLSLFDNQVAFEIANKIRDNAEKKSKESIISEIISYAMESIDQKVIKVGSSIATAKHLAFNTKEDEEKAIKQLGQKDLGEFVRINFLQKIDILWRNHLDNLEALRENVGLMTFAQKNPLTEYKVEGGIIFDNMVGKIKTDMVELLLKVRINVGNAEDNRHKPSQHSANMELKHSDFNDISKKQNIRTSNNGGNAVTIKRAVPKVGRNEPCPCGSGKKYKNCHGKGE